MPAELQANTSKLPVSQIFHEGWEKIHGVKGTFFISALIYAVTHIIFNLVEHWSHSTIVSIVSLLITFVLAAGFVYLGLRNVFDMPIKVSHLFEPFKLRVAYRVILANLCLSLTLLAIVAIVVFGGMKLLDLAIRAMGYIPLPKAIMAIMITIGSLIAGYIFIRLSLTVAIILAQKDIGILAALKLSYQVTRHNVWRVVALVLITFFFMLVSIATLGIGFIWFLPLVYNMWGLMYKHLVGPIFDPVI